MCMCNTLPPSAKKFEVQFWTPCMHFNDEPHFPLGKVDPDIYPVLLHCSVQRFLVNLSYSGYVVGQCWDKNFE